MRGIHIRKHGAVDPGEHVQVVSTPAGLLMMSIWVPASEDITCGTRMPQPPTAIRRIAWC